MEKINSNIEYITMNDGNEVKLSMTFWRLMQLKGNKEYKADVQAAMAVLSSTDVDFLEWAKFAWVAYLCENTQPQYTRAEFLTQLPFDLEAIGNVVTALTTSKKK